MNEIETLIVRRAAEMAEIDGVGVQIVHVFGAASLLSAAIAEVRDRLITHPGQIADVLFDLLGDTPAPTTPAEPEDPVLAARRAADEATTAALEAAQRADELTAEADRLEAERKAAQEAEAAKQAEAERLEAERIAAEQAEADRLEAERIAAEQAATDGEASGEGAPANKNQRKAK